MSPHQLRCGQCKHVFAVCDALRAPNPFDANDTILACPTCHDIYFIRRVCDEPGCNEVVSCGTPTKTGYRQTCSAHRPATTV
jgi:hypothetical protein